jgi:hypothetical protein
MRKVIPAMVLALALAACAGAQSSEDDDVYGLLSGGRPRGTDIERIAAEAARHPLGSEQNPIRVNMPAGERAYLSRLRCSDGAPPRFERMGSGDASPYGSIVDLYAVRCASGEPAESTIWMDMYHPQHDETAAPPGFTLAPR